MISKQPIELEAKEFATLPPHFRSKRTSEWARISFQGRPVDSFLEGPSFDIHGNLYVVDIPYGRIFCIAPDASWRLVCEYEGGPCGLKVHRDGRLFVADYRHGILAIDATSGRMEHVVKGTASGPFKGCNDLVFADDGSLYFTDQGLTGLHDPTGRVFRLGSDGRLDQLLSNVPSPNGIVISPDKNTLFVAVTRENSVWRVPLVGGQPTKVGKYLQLSGGLAGPDGLAMDVEGGIVVCQVGTGILRFDAAGVLTHYVASPPAAIWTNVAFGGEDNCLAHFVDSTSGAIRTARMPAPGMPMYSHLVS